MSDAEADLAAWFLIERVRGLGDAALRRLLTIFGPPDRVFAATRGDLLKAVSESQAAAIAAVRGDPEAQKAVERGLEWSRQPGNQVLTLADPRYPRGLLEVPDPPPILYVKGRSDLLERPAVAIVGSRNGSAQGLANAEQFARSLGEAGLTVVSGQALGIDAAAHRGALPTRGSTIAVIGTGADIVYPARNRDLAHAIAERGLIVSEFPLGTPALAANFPRRNRIISGLSRGVLVVEAALRSGSLITARLAGEQGREVFAIPGSIHSPLSKGCHALIKQGAKLVESAADVLGELGMDGLQVTAPARSPSSSAPAEAGDETRGRVLAAIGFAEADFDTLCRQANVSADKLSALLLELELEGLIARLPGGKVQRLGGEG
jgi:DNA processing protein